MPQENVYERIHTSLTWKRIIAFNLVLFLVTVIPLSVRLAREDTENRSNAANESVPAVTPPPNYPTEAAKIERVSEWFGKKGDTVVVLGKNFGAYQWGSKLYVGEIEAKKNDIVRWSDTVIEVQIPEGARTGKVWLVVNGKQAIWEGSLLLTDLARSALITLEKTGERRGVVRITNGAGVTRGMIELSHLSEPLVVSVPGGTLDEQRLRADSLGKKTELKFSLESPLSSAQTMVMQIEYPGIGGLEILRSELYDAGGNLVTVYADPLTVKFN